MRRFSFLLVTAFLLLATISCNQAPKINSKKPEGKLYIIGGGKRPPEMIEQLVALSGVNEGKYIVVLPF
ncbi:MAG TPA: hypothetical protein PK563_00750, partial [Tenuifilaceae bacterium]|nr:hypothetical protein [Tenuifilaceae bacterium]